jgi:protein-S-isoprenylcysteine O-methyltransferase Ste14
MDVVSLVFLAVIAPIPLFHLVLHAWLRVWRRWPRAYYGVWAVLWAVGAVLAWSFRTLLTARVFDPSSTLTAIGLVIAGASLLLVPWSLFTIGWERFFMKAVLWPDRVPQRRIASGPFRCIRHPAYTAYRIAAIALFLATGFWSLVALAVWLLILTPFVIRLEERELMSRIGRP